MGARKIRVIGDSNLVVKQVRGEFFFKEPALAPYRTAAQDIINKFQYFSIEHTSSRSNWYADALANLGSQIRFVDDSLDVSVVKKDESVLESMNEEQELEDWRSPIKESFTTVSPNDGQSIYGNTPYLEESYTKGFLEKSWRGV